MRSILLAACLIFAHAAMADVSAEDVMNAEIDHLLDTVAASNCTFIRNGKEAGGDKARDHLSLKRRRGAKYFSNAEEFIDSLASSSSWSGKPYHIRCDGEDFLAKVWFTNLLADYRSSYSADYSE